jgi:hypothetical protein
MSTPNTKGALKAVERGQKFRRRVSRVLDGVNADEASVCPNYPAIP